MTSPTIEDLLELTDESEIETLIVKFELNDFYQAIEKRLVWAKNKDIEEMEQIYTLVKTYAHKFKINKESETIAEQLLGQLEEKVAEKVDREYKGSVACVAWYFEYIDLMRLDAVLGRTGWAAYRSYESVSLILSTLKNRLEVEEAEGTLKLPNIREYCYEATRVRVENGGDNNIALAKRIYNVLDTHAEKFEKNDKGESVSEKILAQLGWLAAQKLSAYNGGGLDSICWYFEHINLMQLEDVMRRTSGLIRYSKPSVKLIIDTLFALLETNTDTNIKLPKSRRFLINVVGFDISRNRENEDYQFELPDQIFALLDNAVFSDADYPRPQIYCLTRAMIPMVGSDKVFNYVKQKVDQLPEKSAREDCYHQVKEVRVARLKLEALQTEISEKNSAEVSQDDEPGADDDSQDNDHPTPDTVSDSFDYFNQVMLGYQNYLKNVPKDDARHDIFNTFNTDYDSAATDQAKIAAITAVLQNQESRTTLKKETHGERFIHALKVILSVLTLGLGAIAFAAHAKSKYQNGLFGHNSGAMFLKKCDHFVDIMTAADEDENLSYG